MDVVEDKEKGFEDINENVPVSSEATNEDENESPTEVVEDNADDDEAAAKDAKISELSNSLEALQATIAVKDSEIEKWKAKNFDLLMMMPNTGTSNEEPSDSDDEDDDIEAEEKTGASKLFNTKE